MEFELEVRWDERENINLTCGPKATSEATIVAKCNVDFFPKLYQSIFDVRKSKLFSAILSPSKLRGFSPSTYQLIRSDCVSLSFAKMYVLFIKTNKPVWFLLIFFFLMTVGVAKIRWCSIRNNLQNLQQHTRRIGPWQCIFCGRKRWTWNWQE